MLRALGSTPLSFVDWCLCLLPVVAVWVYMRVRGHDSRARARRLYAMIAPVFALFVSLDAVYQPLVLNTKSDKPQAEFVRRTVPEGLVYSFRTDVVPGNPLHPFTINFYLGDRVLPGSMEFLQALERTGRSYMFLTNNSSRSVAHYVEKLRRLGLSTDESHILTSGQAAAQYLNREYPGKRVFLLGNDSLRQEMIAHGIALD